MSRRIVLDEPWEVVHPHTMSHLCLWASQSLIAKNDESIADCPLWFKIPSQIANFAIEVQGKTPNRSREMILESHLIDRHFKNMSIR